jgi:hypothetical protein
MCSLYWGSLSNTYIVKTHCIGVGSLCRLMFTKEFKLYTTINEKLWHAYRHSIEHVNVYFFEGCNIVQIRFYYSIVISKSVLYKLSNSYHVNL